MKEFNENKEGGITTMENKYPLTAEQYLIKNYEDAKRENLQLKMQNKILDKEKENDKILQY